MGAHGQHHEDLAALLRARGLSPDLLSGSLYTELASDLLDLVRIRVEAALPRCTEQEHFMAGIVVVRTLLTLMEAQHGGL